MLRHHRHEGVHPDLLAAHRAATAMSRTSGGLWAVGAPSRRGILNRQVTIYIKLQRDRRLKGKATLLIYFDRNKNAVTFNMCL